MRLKQRLEILLGTELTPCTWAFYSPNYLQTPKLKTKGSRDYFAVVMIRPGDMTFEVNFWWQPPGWESLVGLGNGRVPKDIRKPNPNRAALKAFWEALPDKLEDWHQDDLDRISAKKPKT